MEDSVKATSCSTPTTSDLYGTTRRRRHKHRNRPSRSATTSRKAVVDVSVVHHAKDSRGPGEEDGDALLIKMRSKEKEFDSKIKEINETFFSAGRQLVMRDDIIERLQAELADLRSQQHRFTQDEERRYSEKERELVERCDTAVSRAKQENEQLRLALDESKARQEQQQRVTEQLMQQLTDADAATRELRRQHEAKLDRVRTKYQEQLQEFDRKLAAVQRRCAELEADRDGMQATHAQSQAKLLGLQMEFSNEKSRENAAMKALWKEKEQLRDEVEAARLSMARLLQVMTEVPDLREYLQWNELDSNFVFLGYPTRYFPVGPGSGGAAGRHAKHISQRPVGNGDSGSDDDGIDGSREHSAVVGGRAGTGVNDGVYGGVASFQDSKNVWLNGRWVQQLQEIIHAENRYTRLRKIKLYELEEAGQVSDGVPTARDVLQCRRQDKDYWVPYAIFQEAQLFKNKYYSKIPALSHFYPFLMRLNAIWHSKLQDRLRTMKKDLQSAQQQVAAMKRPGANPNTSHESYYQNLSGVSLDTSNHHWLRLRQPQHQRQQPNGSRVFLVGLSRSIAEWESQYQHLRRQVRLTVSNQRSLQLFKVYSNLFQSCLTALKTVALQCQQLEEESAFAAEMSTALLTDEDEGERKIKGPERGRNKGRHRSHPRRSLSYFDDDSDGESGEKAVDPLPPPPMRHQKRRSTPPPTAAGSNADDHDEETIESLLCVVQHSCEKVCGVADCLAERMQARCNDLEALMVMLRDMYLPSISAKQRASSDKESEAAATGATAAPTPSPPSSTESPVVAIQRQIRSILREQYGPGYDSFSHGKGVRGIYQNGTEAAYARAVRGVEGSRRSDAPLDSVLPNMVASVFDFSREVREEVLQTQRALQVIATEAMKEAENC